MFAMQYSHRLAADYDLEIIRERVAQRGPQWDDTQGLIFKLFALQQRNQHGATGNVYASIYLWFDSDAAVDFLMGERFQAVVNAFGRPQIETWLPLDARNGAASTARSVYRDERLIDAGVDRAALYVEESERNRSIAARADTVAVWAALDLAAWRLVRFTISSARPDALRGGERDGPLTAQHSGHVYEVLHAAQPERARLG
jgi:Domain of unknown function (DUF4865)